jgi:hypothetical protein
MKPSDALAKQKPASCNKNTLPPATIARLGDRRKATVAAFGILKGTGVFPDDGLEYQLEVRSEWDN